MSDLKKLRALADRKRFSKEDKAYIEAFSREVGCDFKTTKCPDCYRDQVILLISKLGKKAVPEDGRKYALREGLDVIYLGVRICDATITTDEQIEQLLTKGFPKKFVVCR